MTGPRFVTHATYKASNAYRVSTIGVYDRLNGYREVDLFSAGSIERAERLAAKLNAAPAEATLPPVARPVCIVEALNARLA